MFIQIGIKDSLKAYVSLHSYSQMWMVPYGYTSAPSRHHNDLMKIIQKVATAGKIIC